MTWWLLGFGVAGAALMWWKRKPLAKDPYKSADDALITYGEECGQEAADHYQNCKDAVAFVEEFYQKK